jgi:hypothetical protein
MVETTGVWLEPAPEPVPEPEPDDFALDPELSGEAPLPAPGPVHEPETSPRADEAELPEALQGMDMRIVDPADAEEPAREEEDIDFPGLATTFPDRKSAPLPPEPDPEPRAEEIIGVDFSLGEDIFEDMEEIPDRNRAAGQDERQDPGEGPDAPRAEIEFADLLDLEELLIPSDEKK